MIDLNIKLPENFFEEEVRDGYTVTSDMKKVWAIEMDLLNKLLKVCAKHNLKCYADAGTLIGAVRHKGFIPWDDDIDVAMFRDDYEKLKKIASEEFKEPYFFQTAYTDETYKMGHAQLRNSSTTAILNIQFQKKVRYHCGIFIDIFILDGVTPNKLNFAIKKNEIRLINFLLNVVTLEDSVSTRTEKILQKILLSFRLDKHILFSAKEKILRSVPLKNTEYVALLGFIYEIKKRKRNKHAYDDTIWLDFETMKIPAPAGYHKMLTRQYGNYMKPVKVNTSHGEIFFDPDKPYTEYL